MDISLFQIDAFSSNLFEGNPAAVCPLNQWLPDELMQSIAMENNLSETAFFVLDNGRYHIRWFTPTREVELCGHATLAVAYVSPRGGELSCELAGDRVFIRGKAVKYLEGTIKIK